MSVAINRDSQIGVVLASRLGLRMNKQEGHDLAGPCIACKSSDAFRLHQRTGVAQCYSCGGKWSPFQLAVTVLGDRERAQGLFIELGVFKPAQNGGSQTEAGAPPDPIGLIARQKGVTSEALRAFGAKAVTPHTVRLPAYGPDGEQCTHFDLPVRGGKGKFAYHKPAGLFFPHQDGKARLPKPGETWHLVEGPKDAAALHGLDLLACGLNTCRLAAKFARLFTGIHVILIPDRDLAGEEGAQCSARVLWGVASSVRAAVLPAEFKESDGEDVRDVLRRAGGRELILQSIANAQPAEQATPSSPEGAEGDLSSEIEMPVGEPLMLIVSPTFGKPQRLVVAKRGAHLTATGSTLIAASRGTVSASAWPRSSAWSRTKSGRGSTRRLSHWRTRLTSKPSIRSAATTKCRATRQRPRTWLPTGNYGIRRPRVPMRRFPLTIT